MSDHFTEHDVLTTFAVQTAFGAVASSPSARVYPIVRGSQGMDATRNKIENDARYVDGYKRAFVLGNNTSTGELPTVATLDFFAYPLFGLCGEETNTVGVVETLVTAGGTGYTGPFAVTYTGGGGTDAAGTATVVGGVVTSVTMTAPGTGYTSDPTPVFTAGGGTGATGTTTRGQKSVMKPGKIVIPFTFEEGIGPEFDQYLDQVYREMKIDYDNEGMFKPNFSTQGTGLALLSQTTSMDATPTEIAGAPAEFLNWGNLEDDVETGEITKLSLTVTREIIEVRPAKGGTALAGCAVELLVGQTTIALSLSALYKNGSRIANARNGVKAKLEATVTDGWRKLLAKMPETLYVPKSVKKASGQPLMVELEGEAIFESDSASPITFEHTGAIGAHST